VGDFVKWGAGLVGVLVIVAAQYILPFAFDFFTTLAIYGLGVYVGRS
jgi:hypothetical protein